MEEARKALFAKYGRTYMFKVRRTEGASGGEAQSKVLDLTVSIGGGGGMQEAAMRSISETLHQAAELDAQVR